MFLKYLIVVFLYIQNWNETKHGVLSKPSLLSNDLLRIFSQCNVTNHPNSGKYMHMTVALLHFYKNKKHVGRTQFSINYKVYASKTSAHLFTHFSDTELYFKKERKTAFYRAFRSQHCKQMKTNVIVEIEMTWSKLNFSYVNEEWSQITTWSFSSDELFWKSTISVILINAIRIYAVICVHMKFLDMSKD